MPFPFLLRHCTRAGKPEQRSSLFQRSIQGLIQERKSGGDSVRGLCASQRRVQKAENAST